MGRHESVRVSILSRPRWRLQASAFQTGTGGLLVVVSILSRPRWRLQVSAASRRAAAVPGFNPQPATLAAASAEVAVGPRLLRLRVSILSRPRWRLQASCELQQPAGTLRVSILSRPRWRLQAQVTPRTRNLYLYEFQSSAGHVGGCKPSAASTAARIPLAFQSSAGHVGGCKSSRCRRSSRWSCFNPQPATLAAARASAASISGPGASERAIVRQRRTPT